jgi:hypothetical protein
MSYLDYQFEILRGQIEELQGGLEEMLAVRRGRAGLFGSLRGRSRRMRGRARQTYARARYGVMGFKPKMQAPSVPNVRMPDLSKIPGMPAPQPKATSPTKYVLLAVGLVLAVTMLLWPGVLSGLWKQASDIMSQPDAARSDPLTNSEL